MKIAPSFQIILNLFYLILSVDEPGEVFLFQVGLMLSVFRLGIFYNQSF